MDPAKRPFIDDRLQLAVPWLEAEIIVHNQVHTRLGRQPGHALCRIKGAAERLLADNPQHAGSHRLFNHPDMRFRRRRDIQYVDPPAVQ